MPAKAKPSFKPLLMDSFQTNLTQFSLQFSPIASFILEIDENKKKIKLEDLLQNFNSKEKITSNYLSTSIEAIQLYLSKV